MLLGGLVLRRCVRLIRVLRRLPSVVLTGYAGAGISVVEVVGLGVGGRLVGLDRLDRLCGLGGLSILRVGVAL